MAKQRQHHRKLLLVAAILVFVLADSIYWWEPDHPVFNEPNRVLPLLNHSRTWQNQTGDQIIPLWQNYITYTLKNHF
jgi:hypothetical protein